MRGGPILIVLPFLLGSCTNYLLSPESLIRQLAEASPIQADMTGPLGDKHQYLTNNIRSIACYTKDGEMHQLMNGPAIEARITLKNGKRKRMYFDRIAIRNDTLFGAQSRFISSQQVKMPFSDIVRIDLQDGGKRFSYDR